MYLDGLSEEEDIPFSIRRTEPEAGEGPVVREAAAGAAVIDIAAMQRELEATPGARQRT